MVDNLNYLVAPLLVALFGLPAGFAPGLRGGSAAVRLAMSFMLGSVVLVVWGTLLSMVGVPWSVWSVVLPLGATSVATSVVVARRDAFEDAVKGASGWDLLALMIGTGGAAHLILAAATARATSIDFFYFWSVKMRTFAEADGIDAAFLASPFSVHAHVPYPPLVPLIGAWGVELVGRLPWRAGLMAMVIWVVLAYPVVLRGLRSRLPIGEATMASGVWLLAMSLAVTDSYSAGNAEPPLIFFTTVAVVALIAREGVFPAWVTPVALCGIVLTKSEGIVLWGLIVAGSAVRDLLERRPFREIVRRLSGMIVAPALAIGIWVAFEVRHGLPLSDSAREAVGEISIGNLGPAIASSLRHLDAGSSWLAWLIAAVVIVLSWRAWRTILPALAVTLGVLGFLLVYYLHYRGESLDVWVSWTLPRVSMTALSAALLAAAVASGARRAEP